MHETSAQCTGPVHLLTLHDITSAYLTVIMPSRAAVTPTPLDLKGEEQPCPRIREDMETTWWRTPVR